MDDGGIAGLDSSVLGTADAGGGGLLTGVATFSLFDAGEGGDCGALGLLYRRCIDT
jgi:hypothetical protein